MVRVVVRGSLREKSLSIGAGSTSPVDAEYMCTTTRTLHRGDHDGGMVSVISSPALTRIDSLTDVRCPPIGSATKRSCVGPNISDEGIVKWLVAFPVAVPSLFRAPP
jgi:hypothetical protein